MLNLSFICRHALFLFLSVPSLIFWINLSKVLSIFWVSSKNQLLMLTISPLYFFILLLSSFLSFYFFLKIYSVVFYYLKLSAYIIILQLSSLLIEAFNILNCHLSNILALCYKFWYKVFSWPYRPKYFLISITPSVTHKLFRALYTWTSSHQLKWATVKF